MRLGEAAAQLPTWTLDLMHSLHWGIIALDSVLRPKFVNRAAECLLSNADGLRLDRQGLHAAHSWDAHRLRETLARALQGTGGELRVRRQSGEPDWIVSVGPTQLPTLADQGARGVLVHLLDPAARPFCTVGRLQALFGLSLAEARVAQALLTGLSTGEIAVRHTVSISTVRTQVERLYAKTATAGRSQLLILLQSASALPEGPTAKA